MSKMGNFVLDVQERFSSGDTPLEIAQATGVPLKLVEDTIKASQLEDEWPEPDPDF